MNQIHIVCPKAAATGIMSMTVLSVAGMETMLLSAMKYFGVGDWLPSKEPRTATTAENNATLVA